MMLVLEPTRNRITSQESSDSRVVPTSSHVAQAPSVAQLAGCVGDRTAWSEPTRLTRGAGGFDQGAHSSRAPDASRRHAC